MRFAAIWTSLVLFGCQSTAPKPDKPKPEIKAEPDADANPAQAGARPFAFETATVGEVPPGWEMAETNGTGTPARWEVVAQAGVPSGKHAFGVVQTKNSGQTYNLAIAPAGSHLDVDLTVMVKAGTGEEDKGGGFALRLTDPGNYYIARWNPIEKNIKFYKVVAHHRDVIHKVDIDLDVAEWHALRVLAEGERFEIFADQKSVAEIRDSTHTAAGKVGLWTKADAATLFDDFVVTAL